jgi:hypothetical protein
MLQSLDAEQVDRALAGWLQGLCKDKGHAVALDGKTLRGARQGADGQVHLLSALLHGSGVTLGQSEELARFLVEDKGADYCFTVKDNQPRLKQEIAEGFEPLAFPPSAPNA